MSLYVNVEVATGKVLDFLVAKCMGCELSWDDNTEDFYMGLESPYCFLREFNPSTSWAQGGEILDAHRIEHFLILEGATPEDDKWQARRFEYTENGGHKVTECYGKTKLVSGLRCVVIKTFGKKVEVPAELLHYATS